MNYVCSYWLSPDASASRSEELRRYFDLQCYLKKRMGCSQIIITNIEYDDALPMVLPPKFTPKHAFFTRYYVLKQVIENGVKFPICLHDHDFFNAQDLPHNDAEILVGSMVNGVYSEQAVVYPEISKQALLEFIDLLWEQNLEESQQSGYGTEARHEGYYSTEQTAFDNNLRPFKSIPIRIALKLRDQVSFDIIDQHSLESGSATSNEIREEEHGVHGHINKGPASDLLLDWLASSLSNNTA